ncbi:MAG: hypothetical protein WCW13_03475 [archaeon]
MRKKLLFSILVLTLGLFLIFGCTSSSNNIKKETTSSIVCDENPSYFQANELFHTTMSHAIVYCDNFCKEKKYKYYNIYGIEGGGPNGEYNLVNCLCYVCEEKVADKNDLTNKFDDSPPRIEIDKSIFAVPLKTGESTNISYKLFGITHDSRLDFIVNEIIFDENNNQKVYNYLSDKWSGPSENWGDGKVTFNYVWKTPGKFVIQIRVHDFISNQDGTDSISIEIV